MKIDQPLGEIGCGRERSEEKRRFIDRSSRPFPSTAFQASSFGQRLFFPPYARDRSRVALKERGGVMTRTICSGVSTRLFLFSSTAELSFSSSASSYPPVSLPSSLSLSSTCSCFSIPPTDDETGREVHAGGRADYRGSPAYPASLLYQ